MFSSSSHIMLLFLSPHRPIYSFHSSFHVALHLLFHLSPSSLRNRSVSSLILFAFGSSSSFLLYPSLPPTQPTLAPPPSHFPLLHLSLSSSTLVHPSVLPLQVVSTPPSVSSSSWCFHLSTRFSILLILALFSSSSPPCLLCHLSSSSPSFVSQLKNPKCGNWSAVLHINLYLASSNEVQ